MLTADTLNGLRDEIQKLTAGNSLVLLGGSYFVGNATQKSDVDFFVIVSCLSFFDIWRKKEKIIKIKNKYSNQVIVNIAVIPKLFYKLGWFYIYGIDQKGKKYISKFNRDLILRNAFKLSAFYGLKFLSSGDDNWKRKAGKQLAIIKMLSENKDLQILERVDSVDWSPEELLRQLPVGFFDCFSLSNYLIYNLWFLSKLNFNFLFCNPDKKVWKELLNFFKMGDRAKEKLLWLEKHVFPVVIF